MITPFQLDASWRDYWNTYSPVANAQIAPLTDNTCYAPRIRMVPDPTQQNMPSSGKIEYNFVVAPGSIMWGMWAGPAAQLPFTMQLTDIAIGHRMFQEPASTVCLPNSTNSQGSTSPYNYALFPCPWPVVGDGLFTLEIWPGSSANIGKRHFIILGCAEINECS
jgi:hypothetical protein